MSKIINELFISDRDKYKLKYYGKDLNNIYGGNIYSQDELYSYDDINGGNGGGNNDIDTFLQNSDVDYINILENIEDIKAMGEPSSNGFIHKITGKNGRSIVLKSVQTSTSDNLAYEFYTGQCINEFRNKYPTFCKTYAVCVYYTNNIYEKIKTVKNIEDYKKSGINLIKDLHISNEFNIYKQEDMKISCEYTKHLAIIIEYIDVYSTSRGLYKNAVNITKESLPHFNQLVTALYIIYTTLSSLSVNFTHYDLHKDNVMLIKVPQDKYINITYHTMKGNINIKSEYIPVIIDYGRSYTKCISSDSNTYISRIPCPDHKSYEFQRGESDNITPFKSNITQDLRLLKRMYVHFEDVKGISKNELNYIEYFRNNIRELKKLYPEDYGHEEEHLMNTFSGIYNVSEAQKFLETIIKNKHFIKSIENKNSQEYGKLDIYLNDNCSNYKWKINK